jgi:UDP:flavonoid glycosyltransferase YjiC (YdhE family)
MFNCRRMSPLSAGRLLKISPMADISVIHGGIGTVMTAALAGKPVVGVGMQPEQDANLDCLVRKGCAIRISKGTANARKILAAVDKLCHDDEAKRKAQSEFLDREFA